MIEKEIEGIVEEVMRRIRLTSADKRILALMNSPADEKLVDRYLKETGKETYLANRMLINGDSNGGISQGCNIQKLMDEHCSLFVAGITLKQLMRINEMQMEDPFVEVIIEALRMGKPVTVMSKWLNPIHGTPAFNRRINDLKKTLISYGANFAEDRVLEEGEIINSEIKTENYRMNRRRIDKRVIAKQDLKDVLQGELEIREDAVMTSTAKDLLDKRKVRIVRYKDS